MLEATPHHGILFVCTGNICRSPYAERRLRQLLPSAGVPIASAGTGALVGYDIEGETSAQLRALGADTTDFSARAVTPQIVDEAELVLTMTRAQRGEVARVRPAAMRRIFAFGDFVDLCRSSHVWRPIDPSRPWLPQVVVEAAAARGTVAPRDSSEVDVVDPYRGNAQTHDEAFERIEHFLGDLVAALAAVVTSSHARADG